MSQRKLQEQALSVANLNIRKDLDLLVLQIQMKEFTNAKKQSKLIQKKLSELEDTLWFLER